MSLAPDGWIGQVLPIRPIRHLEIAEWCVDCAAHTQHELNSPQLTTECYVCGRTEPITPAYAATMMED